MFLATCNCRQVLTFLQFWTNVFICYLINPPVLFNMCLSSHFLIFPEYYLPDLQNMPMTMIKSMTPQCYKELDGVLQCFFGRAEFSFLTGCSSSSQQCYENCTPFSIPLPILRYSETNIHHSLLLCVFLHSTEK